MGALVRRAVPRALPGTRRARSADDRPCSPARSSPPSRRRRACASSTSAAAPAGGPRPSRTGSGRPRASTPSLRLVAAARRREPRIRPGVPLRARRERLPFAARSVGAAVSFAGAFGRTDDPEDDARAAAEIARVLAPGGALLAAVFNAERVVAGLALREEKLVVGTRVVIRRRYDSERRMLEKEIELGHGRDKARLRAARPRAHGARAARPPARRGAHRSSARGATSTAPRSTAGARRASSSSRRSRRRRRSERRDDDRPPGPRARHPGARPRARDGRAGRLGVPPARPRRVAAVAAQAASRAQRLPSARSLSAGADPRLALSRAASAPPSLTGQQAGLFGGPHLTLVEGRRGREGSRRTSRPPGLRRPRPSGARSEDHDLVEVTRVVLPTPEGPRDFGPDPVPLAANRAPVGALPITADVSAILAAAAEGLGGEPDGEALAFLRDAHAGGSTYADAFAKTLDWLLGGEMPLVDAADAAEKPALVPLAVRIVRERRKVRELLRTRDAELSKAGHPLQVKTDEAALPLFVRADGESVSSSSRKAARLALKGRDGRVLRGATSSRASSPARGSRPSRRSRVRSRRRCSFPSARRSSGRPRSRTGRRPGRSSSGRGSSRPPSSSALSSRSRRPRRGASSRSSASRLEDVLEGEEALLRKKGAGAASGLLARVAAIRDRAPRGPRRGARGPPRGGPVAREGGRRDAGEARVLLREARREDRRRGGPRGRARRSSRCAASRRSSCRTGSSPSASTRSCRTS